MRAARGGPVFITDRGEPAYVLLSIEEYRWPASEGRNFADALSMQGLAGIDFEPHRANIRLPAADLN